MRRLRRRFELRVDRARSKPNSAASASINQSSCNKDYSCINGFCPSFVSVLGGKLRRPGGGDAKAQPQAGAVSASPAASGPAPEAAVSPAAGLASPDLPQIHGSYALLVTGIGGTGVVTIGQILGMAAHLEGKGVTVLDMAGLAQKNGAVMSFVRFAQSRRALVRAADRHRCR